MRILFAAAALTAQLLSAAPAFATDWRWVTQSDSTAVLVDRDTIKPHEGGTMEARLVYVLSADLNGIAVLDALAEFDCTGRRTRRLTIQGRDAQGATVKNQTPSPDWRDVPKGDMGDVVFTFVCSGGKTDSRAATGTMPEMIAEGRRILAK